ncbi:NAC domain containing protein 82, partial [Striga asiatica]
LVGTADVFWFHQESSVVCLVCFLFHERWEVSVLAKGVIPALDLTNRSSCVVGIVIVMARTSLPPGFRFHPTDEELILYYLKRKIMGKKFQLEAIAECNSSHVFLFIADKSCLKSKDLKWFFFCPREKKYASGARVKRATENGYWKTTGKDRPVYHNNKKVGTIKTLIFHLGHAPQGERTNWVLHEYKILDCQLAAAGVQDTYVLCKIFQKNGLGPKNGAQYGAPFNEAEWTDDDIDDDQSHAITFASDGPSTTLLSIEEQSSPPETTELSLIEGPSNPAGEVLVNETDDEIDRLLAPFTDDDMLLFHHYGVAQDGLGGKGKQSLPCSQELDIYNGLGDLDGSLQMNEDVPGFLMENERSYLENNFFLDSSAFIELDDLLPQLDCPVEFSKNVQSSTNEIFRSYGHGNIQQPEGTYAGDNCLLPLHVVNSTHYQGLPNAVYDSDFALGQLDNGTDLAQDIQRGSSADA